MAEVSPEQAKHQLPSPTTTTTTTTTTTITMPRTMTNPAEESPAAQHQRASDSSSPLPFSSPARRYSAGLRHARRKSSIGYVSTPPTSSRVSTPASDPPTGAAAAASPSPSPSPRAVHRQQLSVSSTTSSLAPIAERSDVVPLTSCTPSGSAPETAMAKNAQLLSEIAAHEQKCLELREQLAGTQAELARLRVEWQTNMTSTIAQQQRAECEAAQQQRQESTPSLSPTAPTADSTTTGQHHHRSFSRLTEVLFEPEVHSAPAAGADLAAMQAAATHAFKDLSGRLHNFLGDALATPTFTRDELHDPIQQQQQHQLQQQQQQQSTTHHSPTTRIVSDSPLDSRDPTPTLASREFPAPDPTVQPDTHRGASTSAVPAQSPPDQITSLQSPSSETLHSPTQEEEQEQTDAVPDFLPKNQPVPPSTAQSSTSPPPNTNHPTPNKRTSLFASASWGDWTTRLQEAKTNASALLAKAERGLEGLMVLDEQPSHKCTATASGAAPRVDMVVDIADSGAVGTRLPNPNPQPAQGFWQAEAQRERDLLRNWGGQPQ